jgi:dephospho-CoA kinase
MKLIALTGGIACGKSTVTAEISKQPNVVIIDVDQIARQALNRDSEPYKQLKKHLESDKAYAGKVKDIFRLGEEYAEDVRGTINRELLGSLVFKDASLRKALNKFTHPWVFKKMIGRIWEEWKNSSLFDDKVVVLDMPLYFDLKRNRLLRIYHR